MTIYKKKKIINKILFKGTSIHIILRAKIKYTFLTNGGLVIADYINLFNFITTIITKLYIESLTETLLENSKTK